MMMVDHNGNGDDDDDDDDFQVDNDHCGNGDDDDDVEVKYPSNVQTNYHFVV